MDLHDARVRVIWEGGEAESEVIGGDHRTFKTQQIGNLSRKIVNFSARSTQSPLLRLTPGEETTLSAHFEVPADVTCAVEVAILGSRPRWFLARTFFKPVIGQWRASIVSLPERTHNQERPN